jgi:Hsp20/alpha crystallin family
LRKLRRKILSINRSNCAGSVIFRRLFGFASAFAIRPLSYEAFGKESRRLRPPHSASGGIAPEDASIHRRERIRGVFDRTIAIPIQIDPNGIRAEYRDGVLALFIPRAEREKPRTIKIT